MRRPVLIAAAFLVAVGPTLASSIEVVAGVPAQGSSIVIMNCTACPALKAAKDAKAYKVPQITPGTQSAEIVDVDGEKKLKRTEAWLGGSPVVFFSKAEGWTTNGSAIAAASVGPADGIDIDATTSAVSGAADKTLDVTTFKLRID